MAKQIEREKYLKRFLVDDILGIGVVEAFADRFDLVVKVEQVLEAAVLLGLVAF